MRLTIALLTLLLPAAAHADVVSSNGNGFVLRHRADVPVAPAAAFNAYSKIGSWWSPGHTYSGDSKNLSLSPVAGGCFCERLKNNGGVEHMRVAYIEPGKSLVLTGGLGPLLYEATAGVMTVRFEPAGNGSRVTMEYKVAGFASGGADKLAAPVDSVLAEQFKRYVAFASGRPTGR
jgi:hypothetical protein